MDPLFQQSGPAAAGAEPQTMPGAVKALLAEGRKLAREGQIDGALRLYDTALGQIGEDPEALAGALREKGWVQAVQGDLRHAFETFHRLTAVAPASPDGWLAKGWILLHDGKPEQALDCAERAVAVDRSSPGAHALRGDCLLRLGRGEEAFAAFAVAAQHDKQQFDASDWAARGDQFLDNGAPDLAFRAYEAATSLDGGNPQSWYGKGIVHRMRGEIEPALAALTHASELGGEFIAGYLEAGRLCFDGGDLDRARKLFERASAAQPQDARPLVALAGVYGQLGRYEEARAAYEAAAAREPQDADIWNALGNSLYQLDRYEEGLHAYRRALEVTPEHGWAHHNLAWALVELGQVDEALVAIDQAIDLEPRNPAFLTSLMRILTRFDRIDAERAKPIAERALEAAGDDINYRLDVASFLLDNLHPEEAGRIARDIDPNALKDDETRLSLIEVLLQLHEHARALRLVAGIDPARLPRAMRVVCFYLHLLADRLAGAGPLSGRLLEDLLHALSGDPDKTGLAKVVWNYKGVHRLLAASSLPPLELFALATLADLQEGKIRRRDLTFFRDLWDLDRARRSRSP